MKTTFNFTKTLIFLFLIQFLAFESKSQISILVDKSDYNGVNISCNGMNDGWISINTFNSVGNPQFIWSNGETTSTISNLPAGLYEVIISDSVSSQAVSIELIESSPLVAQTISPVTNWGYNLICNNDNKGRIYANVSGAIGKITYEWSNGSLLPSLSGLASGSYQVTVTDDNGCFDTSSITLTEPSPVQVTATLVSQTSAFNANDGSAVAVGTGGQGQLSYLWDNNENDAVAFQLSAGWHAVKAIDNYGCSARFDILITSQDGLTAPVRNNSTIVIQHDTISRGSRATSLRPNILNNDIKNEGIMIQNIESFTENLLVISDMMGNIRLQMSNVKSVNDVLVNLESGHYVAILSYRNEIGEFERVTNKISIR